MHYLNTLQLCAEQHHRMARQDFEPQVFYVQRKMAVVVLKSGKYFQGSVKLAMILITTLMLFIQWLKLTSIWGTTANL